MGLKDVAAQVLVLQEVVKPGADVVRSHGDGLARQLRRFKADLFQKLLQNRIYELKISKAVIFLPNVKNPSNDDG